MTNKFDRHGRIKRLEKKVDLLTKIIESAGLTKDFIPLSKAAKILDINSWVIRDRIKKDDQVKLNHHYKKNGNRYLINIEAWQLLIENDAKKKEHQI